ncbi:hypothetical protein CBL_20758 [Carabus blaptoides fortunei]
MKPKLIKNGTKIMLMEIDYVRFIDSINFLPMSLSNLIKARDLPLSIKTGYFPHLFNTLENSIFLGPIPFYGMDSMHSGILRRACTKFRSTFLDDCIGVEHKGDGYFAPDKIVFEFYGC